MYVRDMIVRKSVVEEGWRVFIGMAGVPNTSSVVATPRTRHFNRLHASSFQFVSAKHKCGVLAIPHFGDLLVWPGVDPVCFP